MIQQSDPIWPFYSVTAEVQRAYQSALGSHTPGAQAVIADLARYCHAFAPTETEREVGRRDVWLHIMKRLMLRDVELTALLGKLPPEQRVALFDTKTPVMFSPR